MRSEDFLLSKDLSALFFKIILCYFDIKFVIVSLSKTLIIITSTYWALIVALTLNCLTLNPHSPLNYKYYCYAFFLNEETEV